jgi:hypothetical protein
MILQTDHLLAIEDLDHENKGLSLQDLQNTGVMVSLELLLEKHKRRHKPEAGGFCLFPRFDYTWGVKGLGVRRIIVRFRPRAGEETAYMRHWIGWGGK